MTEMMKLADKDLERAIVNMFKDLKKCERKKSAGPVFAPSVDSHC